MVPGDSSVSTDVRVMYSFIATYSERSVICYLVTIDVSA